MCHLKLVVSNHWLLLSEVEIKKNEKFGKFRSTKRIIVRKICSKQKQQLMSMIFPGFFFLSEWYFLKLFYHETSNKISFEIQIYLSRLGLY